MSKKIINPFYKTKELAIEYDVSEGMISDILKKKDRWLAIDIDSYQAGLKREKKIPFPIIEEALTLWVEKALQARLIITDNILVTKALEFALLCQEEKFKGSSRWNDNFKKRHNIKQYTMHGEAASAPIQDLSSMRENLRQTLRDYDPKDIFNCDETGLFWKMKPSRTLSNSSVARSKQSKDHITILLTCNSTGTEKMRSCLFINMRIPEHLKTLTKTLFLSIITGIKRAGCRFPFGTNISRN